MKDKPINFIYKGEATISDKVEDPLLKGQQVDITYQTAFPNYILCAFKRNNGIIYLPYDKLNIKTMVNVTFQRHLDDITHYLEK